MQYVEFVNIDRVTKKSTQLQRSFNGTMMPEVPIKIMFKPVTQPSDRYETFIGQVVSDTEISDEELRKVTGIVKVLTEEEYSQLLSKEIEEVRQQTHIRRKNAWLRYVSNGCIEKDTWFATDLDVSIPLITNMIQAILIAKMTNTNFGLVTWTGKDPADKSIDKDVLFTPEEFLEMYNKIVQRNEILYNKNKEFKKQINKCNITLQELRKISFSQFGVV